MSKQKQCADCNRKFDMLNECDAEEWLYGHDCEPSTDWRDHVNWARPVTEEDVWSALADANGLEYSDIADGDLAAWL